MSHHFRSFSEHQQRPVIQSQQQQQQQTFADQPTSFIRTNTDSIQQSLEQLFNPIQTTVPLKDRQLPRSFFDPTYGQQQQNNYQQVHSRSVSYDQRPSNNNGGLNTTNNNINDHHHRRTRPMNNLHARTTSTLAPMPVLASSNQSSHETLNNHPQVANGVNPRNHQEWPPTQQMDDHEMATDADLQHQHQPTYPANGIQAMPVTINHHHHNQVPMHVRTQATPIIYTGIQQQAAVPSTTLTNANNNNIHTRSMSFDQSQGPVCVPSQNFHMRTQSTVIPANNQLTNPTGGRYHQLSSQQSSHEVLNHGNSSNVVSSAASSGYSTDDMTNCWVAGQLSHQQHVAQPQQVVPGQQLPQQQLYR